ncbi:unnamed protein product [Rhizoctonia solani]|uniref:Uncharacterized protein n=1 Tax=Rhizoctonia solani TaxID=456999 RepID=A0A8H2WZD5_9AGAM|nr:unnamed protein product [Rhizoctonia solani]
MALNTRNPLLLHEIAHHVASLCSLQERCDWAYTCKTIFAATVPIIWEHVYNVEHILQLIPGIKITKEPDPSVEGKTIISILLDEMALSEDWTRYWRYAPFVKRLTLFTPHILDGDRLRVQGWYILLVKLREGALLPNLHTLNTEAPYKTSPFDRLAWSALFLSPSLRVLDLDTGYCEQRIDPQRINSSSLLLAALSESLPDHSKNTLSVRYEHPSEHALVSAFPTEYQEGYRWFNNTPNLAHLRKLGLTVFHSPQLLCDALCVIGHLPLLERLKLDFGVGLEDEPDGGYDLNRTLPCSPTLFPSLRRLHLERVPNARIFRWIWGLKPLVSGISMARIDRRFSFNSQEFNTSIIQPMREGCPSLSNISISMFDRNQMGVLETACELVSRIPLKELELRGMANWGSYPVNHQTSTFTHLRRLCILAPLELGHWRECSKLVKALPNLEYLFIWPAVLTLETQSPDDAHIKPALQPIEIEIREPIVAQHLTKEAGKDHTRSLLLSCLKTVWPNASFLGGWIAHSDSL